MPIRLVVVVGRLARFMVHDCDDEQLHHHPRRPTTGHCGVSLLLWDSAASSRQKDVAANWAERGGGVRLGWADGRTDKDTSIEAAE